MAEMVALLKMNKLLKPICFLNQPKSSDKFINHGLRHNICP